MTDSATAGFSFEFDIDDVVMINHNYFKMNETITEQVALPHLLNGLMTISYKTNLSFQNINDHKEKTIKSIMNH